LVAGSLRDLQRITEMSDAEMSTLRGLAEELGIAISDSSVRASEREKIVSRVTLLPIAQECVIMMLRSIFEQSASGITEFREEQLRKISDEISSRPEFSRHLGLSPEDATLALAHTTEAFLSDALFNHPTKLAVDEDTYWVRREADHLIVQPAA
jgi:hypothetical protein